MEEIFLIEYDKSNKLFLFADTFDAGFFLCEG